MNRFKLHVGDYYDDGHGKYKTVFFETTLDGTDLLSTFKASEELTGVTFECIADDYEDSKIDKPDFERLLNHGFADFILARDKPLMRSTTDYYIDSVEEFADIIVWFVGLSLPEGAVFRVVSDNIPTIDLPVSGYGLFL